MMASKCLPKNNGIMFLSLGCVFHLNIPPILKCRLEEILLIKILFLYSYYMCVNEILSVSYTIRCKDWRYGLCVDTLCSRTVWAIWYIFKLLKILWIWKIYLHIFTTSEFSLSYTIFKQLWCIWVKDLKWIFSQHIRGLLIFFLSLLSATLQQWVYVI